MPFSNWYQFFHLSHDPSECWKIAQFPTPPFFNDFITDYGIKVDSSLHKITMPSFQGMECNLLSHAYYLHNCGPQFVILVISCLLSYGTNCKPVLLTTRECIMTCCAAGILELTIVKSGQINIIIDKCDYFRTR